MKTYWITGAALLGYLILAWVLGGTLQLETGRFYLLYAILAVLGILAAAAFLWFWKKAEGGIAGGSTGAIDKDDEIDALVREAETRLASSNLARGAKIANLPVIFVIGDPGSTKTSTIVHSGLEAELLAGNVGHDNAVMPTRIANIWFANGIVFVEAGGKLLLEDGRWAHLLQRLRPARLQSVMSGRQAPRAVLLCFDAETFARTGSTEALSSAARNVQKHLTEVSRQFGINYPVYVLFTRMNRVAFFEDFVHNLTNEEVTQVLGATLPLREQKAAGIYAEEETKRLSTAFDGIFYWLADHRITFMPRENDFQKVPGAYEFPREFRKIRKPLIQFLVDLCRPSQLHAGPFLRGFYFSGVRPVIVQDTPVVAPRPSAGQRSPFEAAASATGIFQAGGLQAPATPAPPSGGGTRKVPQWLFLGQLFTGVIRRDDAAFGASGSSTKTNTLQRVLLASAAALLLIFAIGFTISFFGNRALENEVLQAAQAIPSSELGTANLPTPDALQSLDRLRETVVKLAGYEKDGAPFGLRWFLYSGGDLYPNARRVYYDRFNSLLFAQTQRAMLGSLQGLSVPPAPTDDYALAYDTLKAYLITTSEWKRTSGWLSPALVSRWSAGRDVAAIAGLARKQFDFYAEDLANTNPFGDKPDMGTVERARAHLAKFSGIEQIYQFMLSDASRKAAKINFNAQFPGSAETVVNNTEIPGAFSKAGWTAMKENLAKADQFFGGERWVLGDYAAAKPESAKLESELRDRYTADYIAWWREFLGNTVVVRYGSLQDAAKKLNALSGAQTPLMALFWLATQNTAVDSPKVTDAFDALHKVVPPPATTTQYVWPSNQEYMGSLATLQTTVSQMADAGAPDPNGAASARQSADAARNVVKKMGYAFKIDTDAHLETIVTRLLEAPINYSDALIKGAGSGEINAKARQFCAAYASIFNKFPFSSSANGEATLQEIHSIFRPRDGRLWSFYNESLQTLMTKQGTQYTANPSASVPLAPAFVAFFNAAARFSDALYPAGATDPALRYGLTPQSSDQISDVSVTVDGQTSRGTGSVRRYVWPGSSTHNLRISAKVSGGTDFEVQNREGLWALFRFFADADRWSPSSSGYLLEWVVRQGREGRPVMVGGKELTYRLIVDTGGAAPVFQKEFLSGMRCVSQATR